MIFDLRIYKIQVNFGRHKLKFLPPPVATCLPRWCELDLCRCELEKRAALLLKYTNDPQNTNTNCLMIKVCRNFERNVPTLNKI